MVQVVDGAGGQPQPLIQLVDAAGSAAGATTLNLELQQPLVLPALPTPSLPVPTAEQALSSIQLQQVRREQPQR